MSKMPKTQEGENRISFSCDVCGVETLATRKLEVIALIDEIYHISEWRVCPVRGKEKGCGHWQLFNYEITAEEMEQKKKGEQAQYPSGHDE